VNAGAGRRWARLGAVLLAVVQGLALAQPAAPQRIEIQGQALSTAEERRQALQLMTVVGREELDAYGDTSVLDVLQRLPGISIDGDQPRMRGMGGGYTLILLNGEPAPPGFSLDQLSPADIERIEIVKGPSAEFGGTAGTINVILRAPPRQQQREARGSLSYRSARPVGSLHLSWGDRVGALGLQVPVSVYQWAGENTSTIERLSRGLGGQPTQERVAGQDQWHGGGLNLGPRFDWRFSDTLNLQWNSFLQANETGNANQRHHVLLQGQPLAVADEHTQAWGRWQLARTQLLGIWRPVDGARLEFKAGWQDSRGRNHTRYAGQGGVLAAVQRETLSNSDETRSSAGLKLRWPLATGHVLVAGWDLETRRRHELRRLFEGGTEMLTPSQGQPFDVQALRQVGFLQDEWSVSPRLSALLGVRSEVLRTQSAGPTGVLQARSAAATPVAQFRWALDDKGRDLLRGSASRASRAPDLSTLMGRYVLNGTYDRFTANTPLSPDSGGNPALQPESAWALELAVERHLAGGGVLSVGLFHRRIEGLIRRRIALEVVPEATVPRWVSRPVNLGRARSTGLELEAKGRADQWLPGFFAARSPLGLRASLSVYRSRVVQIDDPDARLEGQPPWQVTLGLDRLPQGALPGFGANLAYTPSFATRQSDLQRVRRSASQRLDVYALWRFSRELQLRVAVQQVLPRDAQTTQSLSDDDGLVASSTLWRPVQRQFNAHLVWRF
jgi:outer membrane receptor for ferrienterochelin and colicins